MSTINQLNTADQVSGSDLLPLYSQANGDARKISLTNFMNWLAGQSLATSDNKVTQYAAPASGDTVQVQDSQNSIWLILTPNATLSGLTLQMPLGTNVLDKTELLVNTKQSVVTFAVTGNGSSVYGAPASLVAGDFFTLRYDAVMKTWYRVG